MGVLYKVLQRPGRPSLCSVQLLGQTSYELLDGIVVKVNAEFDEHDRSLYI